MKLDAINQIKQIHLMGFSKTEKGQGQLNSPIKNKYTNQLFLKFNNLISKVKSKYYLFSFQNSSINDQ